MATKTLVANKLRSSLTMLGIIIGNASVIAMVGLGEGAQTYINGQLQTLGPNVLFVLPGSRETRQQGSLEVPRTLVVADADAISAQVPSVVGVAPEFNDQGRVVYRNRSANVSIVGTSEQFLQVRSFEMAQGRFIAKLDLDRNAQVAVLGASLAERLFDQQSPVGQSVQVKGIRFEITGVLAAKGANLGLNYDDAVLVPITTQASRLVGQRRSPYGIEVSYIAVSAQDRDRMGQAEFQITNLLRLRHNITDSDDFFINSQDTLLNLADTVTGALTVLLAAIAGISLLVGGIGIMNIMLVSVRERTQEIGLRKAIGASQQDILVQFLIESLILSVVGGIVGSGLGIGGLLLISAISPFEAGVSVSAITLAVGVSGGIGLFFGVFPARQAAQLDPIVALRSS
ncbi:ABC transporter permease [Leptolyngbya sp. PCC 6406]|uniref:ABC transporter permease n=1 Tax=Leptolyngbya sp. PCC 6406 TaxID=1173264 RepID=UPI002938E8F5|nr:ABC transporter permease [Leptolyngbya sp. PCC 6406]